MYASYKIISVQVYKHVCGLKHKTMTAAYRQNQACFLHLEFKHNII